MIRTVTTTEVREITVLLVRMTVAQLANWKWVAIPEDGEEVMEGYEVRDTTGTLLGLYLSLGHMRNRAHVEWYDPASQDFYPAGETMAYPRHAVSAVLDQRARRVGPVPTGEGFNIDGPLYRWNPRPCDPECPQCAHARHILGLDRLAVVRHAAA